MTEPPEASKASEAFDAVDIIATKRDHGVLTDAQIDWVIDAYTRGAVAEEQMAALNMAILLNGMSRPEIARWTAAMIASGERMDFSSLSQPTADKHSTGGVGDKITLPLAPLVATFGVAVPQLSGRGLGHTGGTLDKLESIPGWRAALSNAEMLAQLEDVGAKHRGAQFVCAGALVTPEGREEVREGIVRGRLLTEPIGEGGFGYDPLFMPDGHDRSYAQLSAEEKNAISHRSRVFRELAPLIAQVLAAR